MFVLAFLIAIYGYFIFALGLLGLLYKETIAGVTGGLLFFSGIGCFILRATPIGVGGVEKLRRSLLGWFSTRPNDKRIFFFILTLLVLQALVNLIGVFGPELSFDALWYHLTLPKVYFINHRIDFIPGGLLYYSAAPQLGEMFYTVALALFGVMGAKMIHFLFGIGCLWAIYRLSRKFLSSNLSLLVCLIFYSQLTVGWLSISAYTDLIVVFFQTLAFLAFVLYLQKKKDLWLWESALLFGIASSVKLTSLYAIASVLFVCLLEKIDKKKIAKFILFASLPLLPWFFFAFLKTNNPFYPFLTAWFFKSQSNGLSLAEWLASRHPVTLVKALWQTVFTKGDILTPLVLIGLPIVFYSPLKNLFIFFVIPGQACLAGPSAGQTGRRAGIYKDKKFILEDKKVILNSFQGLYKFPIKLGMMFYLLFNFLFWFLTPLNYNRFLLPLVPIFILVLLIELDRLWRKTLLWKVFIFASLFIALLNLTSRAIVNYKFIPLILGKQTEERFMRKHLNFQAGNFYDIDNFFKKNIAKEERVLTMGIHNLFYVNFPFKDISWARKDDCFDYLLVGRDIEKERFKKLPLVYKNKETGVSLYRVKIIFN